MVDSDFQDRRKNGRIKGRKEAILVTPNGMHSIQDISAGGLSFFCDESEILPAQLPIEIIFAGTPLYMKDIPVRLVREEISDDGDSGSHSVKKIGIEFLELDVHNALLLEKLFKYLTEGNA
jgi:hypothetical protein